MKGIHYFFKRKLWQIKNVFKWLPVIWNQYDFDYIYAIEVFKFQLSKTAKVLQSSNARTSNAVDRANRINTALKLLDKVYNEDYGCEYQTQIKEKYGNFKYEFIPSDSNNGYYSWIRVWENSYSKQQIDAIEKEEQELFIKSQAKQKKAHRIVWQLIEKDIQGWWD